MTTSAGPKTFLATEVHQYRSMIVNQLRKVIATQARHDVSEGSFLSWLECWLEGVEIDDEIRTPDGAFSVTITAVAETPAKACVLSRIIMRMHS